MKNSFLSVIVFVLAALASFPASAKVSLPHVFGDNMVLQQRTDARIWGTAAPSSEVTLRPSWDDGSVVSTKADEDGKWVVTVPTPAAGGPYSIVISDGEDLQLSNVLVGEVWVCSGQSNMEMPLLGKPNQPVEGAADLIVKADGRVPIRMCTLSRAAEFTPQDDCDASWAENCPEAVANTSAVAYSFAKYVHEVLDVPVGIIVTSWGGTMIEAWMDRETVSSDFPEMDLSFIDREEYPKDVRHAPVLLYNGMIHPLVGFAMRGMLWYQGESNIDDAEQYLRLQPAFVRMLRSQWGIGDFPFYYVQIAPYEYDDPRGEDAARLREAQMKALELIPNSGMAVTLDIGDCGCIHPAKKQEVGQRLALLALTQTYGVKGIDPYAPIYDSWEVADGRILVSFKTGVMGLAPLGHVLDGFEVAGADRVFHPATAVIVDGNRLEVFCPEVAEPAAVRYGFRNCAGASLYNCFGIPASPFRTDSW